MHISDVVIESMRRSLRPYAKAGALPEPEGEGASVDPFGVQVLYHKTAPIILFAGVTDDDIQWHVEVDMRAYSRDYRAAVISGVREGIQEKRRKRRGLGPIVLLDEVMH